MKNIIIYEIPLPLLLILSIYGEYYQLRFTRAAQGNSPGSVFSPPTMNWGLAMLVKKISLKLYLVSTDVMKFYQNRIMIVVDGINY